MSLSSFREEFQGEIIDRNHSGYPGARIVWNGMIDRYPALIARCSTPQDVAAAIRFGREQDMVIAVRSGGHSVGGFSTCDDGLVIDISPLHGVSVDPDARIATVRGGTLLKELDTEAQKYGLACPVGVVSHTGVAGLTLGGGMGRLQRKYGFTIDNLAGVEMITANGDVVHSSEEENPDLFWGLRGAGPNFGIATSFQFKLHPVGPKIGQTMGIYTIDRAQEIIEEVRDRAQASRDEIMVSFLFGIVGPTDPWPHLVGHPVVLVRAVHCGDPDDFESDLAAFRFGDALSDDLTAPSYLELQGGADDVMAWGMRFYMKGGFTAEISPELVDLCIERVSAAPGECSVGFWTQGGQIDRVPEDAMAFTGRHPFWMGVEAFWKDATKDADMVGWGRATWDALAPHKAEGHYANDMIETSESIVRAIYGNEKYEKLVQLKRTYDPDNVFHLNQNIAP